MNWISIKDGIPEKECKCVVVHVTFYPFDPICAIYKPQEKCFIFVPGATHLPSAVPIDVTHWIEIPAPPIAPFFRTDIEEAEKE
jgi:hypothetical protein